MFSRELAHAIEGSCDEKSLVISQNVTQAQESLEGQNSISPAGSLGGWINSV